MQRKFIRDKLRKKYGNKNLREIWEGFQRQKYKEEFEEICIYTQRRSK